MKRIQVIAKQQVYLNIIVRQLEEIFGDQCQLCARTLQEITPGVIAEEDLIIISKEVYKGIIEPFIPKTCTIIVAEREINIVGTKQIFDLPKGERILVINDTAEHAEETVKSLEKIYFEHHYFYYDPEHPLPENIQWIVTPGEAELVPKGFSNIIDIGPRGISFSSVKEIEKALNVQMDQITLMNRFFKSHLVLMDKTLTNLNSDDSIYVAQEKKSDYMTLSQEELKHVVEKIEEHGFLQESLFILEIYQAAKTKMQSIGRMKVKEALLQKDVKLSDQQLRLRLEVMQSLELLIARQGRSGTKISDKGEQFLKQLQ